MQRQPVIPPSVLLAPRVVRTSSFHRYRRWIFPTLVWLAVARWLFSVDPEHVRLYLIVTVFIMVAYNLSSRQRREGEKSAYAMLNPGGERLDGDTSLASFGLRDAPRRAAADSESGTNSGWGKGSTLGVHPTTTLGRYEARLLDPVFDGDVGAFREYLAALCEPGAKHKNHHKCPCGSGSRFASCCAELQLYLRQVNYGKDLGLLEA
jgi:hypothetical protein